MSGGRCQLMDTLTEREWGYPVKFSKSRVSTETFGKKRGRQSEGRLRRPRLISARLGDNEHLRAFLLFFRGRCLFGNAIGNRAFGTPIRYVQDLVIARLGRCHPCVPFL
eukprot:TRINITY_DN7019_c0_g1_i3.p3 TRINITY_DN7019_c0_g1~~TRINITY_DN7019_c0_g1_i3.p3  ORF type:complete len:109 (-),score=6.86 TRINITY_DN7019_c0_g1_i3:1726-2052(-)